MEIYKVCDQRELHVVFLATSKQQHESGIALAQKGKPKTIDEPKVGSLHHPRPLFELSIQPKRDKFAGLTRKAKRRKMALEADKELGETGAVNAAIRSAKKAARPAKIGIPDHRNVPASKRTKARKGASKTGGNTFDRDLSSKAARGEGVRAKKGDAIGGMGKRKGGKRRE